MKSQNLQGLLDRVRDGDADAAQQLHRALQPVLSRAVRRILQDQEYDTPLGQRVWGVLAEDGACPAPADDLVPTALAVAQKICRQTVAGLKAPGRAPQYALETVWA
jgi:hypothetical protein